MEEEKLLRDWELVLKATRIFAVIVILNVANISYADDIADANIMHEDAIKQATASLSPFDTSNVYVFVSSSMGDTVIRAYIAQAVKYDAILVYRGLIEDNFIDTGNYIKKLADGREDVEAAIQIDPLKFRKFNIKQVPAIVLHREYDCINGECLESFDKVTGCVPIRYALEEFESHGDNRQLATDYLSGERW